MNFFFLAAETSRVHVASARSRPRFRFARCIVHLGVTCGLLVGSALPALAEGPPPVREETAKAPPAARSVPLASDAEKSDAEKNGDEKKSGDEEDGDEANAKAEVDEAPSVTELRKKTEKIRQLLAGTLPLGESPKALFDIPLSDEKFVQVERARIEELFAEGSDPLGAKRLTQLIRDAKSPLPIEERAPQEDQPPKKHKPDAENEPGAENESGAEPELRAPPLPTPEGIDPKRWTARLELDQARLEFYQLELSERKALLEAQAEKEKADLESKKEQALTSADKDVARAEKEEQEALIAARNARSEAERSVHAELARLLGIAKEQAEHEKSLIERRSDATAAHDGALKIRRKLSDKIGARESDPYFAGPPLDTEYVELRTRLKAARGELGRALSDLARKNYRVPVPGEDRLTDLPEDVGRHRVDVKRAELTARAEVLEGKEQEYQEERSRLLMAEVEMLNRLRLQAIPHLSSEKRDSMKGFNPAGLDQAKSEARQVWLTLLYHYQATKNWFLAMRAGTGRGESAWAASLLTLRWLFPLALFIWWRRRSENLLNLWIEHASASAKKRVATENFLNWNVALPVFLKRIHRPLEALLLIWSVLYLLPDEVTGLLEIQLPVTVLKWLLGGGLAVAAIDALSSTERRPYPRRGAASKSPALRLRSLRLVGRTVVAFGLILSLSSSLVGKGTIYSWVFSTCWFAAIPVTLVVVAWWKPIIYERLEQIRRKGKLETWVLAQEKGATSFIAALLGGAFLFGTGAVRVFRSWVVTFTIVRRLLAYLFRRDMSKKANDEKSQLMPLAPESYAALGPEQQSAHMVESIADDQIKEIIRRIDAQGGGVYAIVGERGSGKTTTLERIASADERITYVTCPTGGLVPFKEALNEALALPTDAPFSAAAAQLDGGSEDTAVLIDNAQHLILPMMGGLKEFDRVLELARDTSANCTWIFAVDEALWRFLERARGSRPLFDEAIHLSPWAEPSIVKLLIQRNARAGISPSFENLLSNLPADADEVDVAEAVQATEDAYYRLLWDYASGNPAVALHFWRKSLGTDAHGKVCVKLFRAPEAEALEGLPDSAVFVLRATVQLGHASLEQVCAATSLPFAQVKDALRYGVAKGYFIHENDHYRITWNWFRAITRFLKRRHMLFSG